MSAGTAERCEIERLERRVSQLQRRLLEECETSTARQRAVETLCLRIRDLEEQRSQLLKTLDGCRRLQEEEI